MGNKLVTSWNARLKKAFKGMPATTSLKKRPRRELKVSDTDALAAELQAAHENASKLVAGVDLLTDELRLEQQLAALDDEDIIMDGSDATNQYKLATDVDDLDLDALDPEELAELEGELQDLERLVLGISAEEEEEEGEGSAAAQSVAEEDATAMEEGEESAGCQSASAASAGSGAPDTPTVVVTPWPCPAEAGEHAQQLVAQSAGPTAERQNWISMTAGPGFE
ncbi:hypothetical protein Vafri_9982 [Volvox africanus]|uniref:Uncharacterized protein n=1 Tax=Volvox africanus TaxID=51714 RepID=A0A8J4B5C8_9CHLO|nr:hypothetical protein Vafri_9982 [Volvox africanus]